MRRLLECKDDITGHLQSYHLSKLVGNVEEHDLLLIIIVLSPGDFNWIKDQIAFSAICDFTRNCAKFFVDQN